MVETSTLSPHPGPQKNVRPKGAIVALVIYILVTIFLVVAIFLPWYNMNMSWDIDDELFGVGYSSSMDSDLDFYLEELTESASMEMSTSTGTESESYSESEEYQEEDSIKGVMSATKYMTIISIVICIITLILIMVAIAGKVSYKKAMILGTIPMIFLILQSLNCLLT